MRYKCKDCGKEISKWGTRCNSCAGKIKVKLSSFKIGDLKYWKNKKLSKEHKDKFRKVKLGKKLPHTKEWNKNISKTTKGKKNLKVKHHLYGKEFTEIFNTTRSIHTKIHITAYWYILEKYGKKGINKYIKWFFERS